MDSSLQAPAPLDSAREEATAEAKKEQQRQASRERSPRLIREEPDLTKEEIVAPLFQNGATKGLQEAL